MTRSFLPSVESQASGAADLLLDHAPGPATLRDQWQTRTRPRGHSAVEVLGLEPAQAQALGGAIAPRAAPAHRQYDLLLRYLRQARRELSQRDVLRSFDVPGIPFVLLADVEQM